MFSIAAFPSLAIPTQVLTFRPKFCHSDRSFVIPTEGRNLLFAGSRYRTNIPKTPVEEPRFSAERRTTKAELGLQPKHREPRCSAARTRPAACGGARSVAERRPREFQNVYILSIPCGISPT